MSLSGIQNKKHNLHALICSCFSNPTTISYRKLKEVSLEHDIKCGELLEFIRHSTHKKIFSFYGNCQTVIMESILAHLPEFARSWILFSFGGIHHLDGVEQMSGFAPEIIQNIDCFVYQNVFGRTRIPSGLITQNMTRNLRRDAIQVRIPNIYFDGYFPQVINTPHHNVMFPSNDNQCTLMPLFPYEDININKMMPDYSTEEIAAALSDPKFYSKQYCRMIVEKSISNLKQREGLCDVKISDYIEECYRTIPLFYTTNHPRQLLMRELLERVLGCLGLNYNLVEDSRVNELDTWEILIYPSVAQNLGLSFEKRKFFWCKLLCEDRSDFREYVSAYVHYMGNSILAARENDIVYHLCDWRREKVRASILKTGLESKLKKAHEDIRVLSTRYDTLLQIVRSDFENLPLPSKFIIYGAGNIAKAFYDKLSISDKQKVLCFCDKYSYEKDYSGVPILRIENARTYVRGEGTFIVTVAYEAAKIEQEIHAEYPSANVILLTDIFCGMAVSLENHYSQE